MAPVKGPSTSVPWIVPRRVDGEAVVGRLVVAGGVVVLEAEAEAVQRRVAGLADRGAASAARRACGWSAGP